MSAGLSSRFKMDEVIEIGLDETGRGPFFGPMMGGAVCLPMESEWTDQQRNVFLQLRDSKKIAPKKRERLADELQACLSTCGVGVVHANEINERGIQWANREVFRRALSTIWDGSDGSEVRLLIDGTLALDDWKGEQELIIEGDNKYIAIAGASILAKVAHDRWIATFAEENPEINQRYDLLGSKGYGTAKHREGIKLYGGHFQHRDLYIQRWLPGAISISKPRAKSSAQKQQWSDCLIRFNVNKESALTSEREKK